MEQTEKPKSLGLGFVNGLNKPFLILGLKIEYFVIYVVGLLLIAAIHQVLAGIIFLCSFPLLKKVDKENKKGNPDYLSDYLRGSGPGQYLEDRNSILNYLSRKTQNGKGPV